MELKDYLDNEVCIKETFVVWFENNDNVQIASIGENKEYIKTLPQKLLNKQVMEVVEENNYTEVWVL